jgi:hypothetical protein
MSFLYHCYLSLLENLRARWHFVTQQRRSSLSPANYRAQEPLMLDVIMLALGLGFFAAGIGYAYACERL